MVSFQDARDEWMEVVKAKEVSSTEGRKSYFPSEEPGFCPMPSNLGILAKSSAFYSAFFFASTQISSNSNIIFGILFGNLLKNAKK